MAPSSTQVFIIETGHHHWYLFPSHDTQFISSYVESVSLKCLKSVHFTLSFAASTYSTYSMLPLSFYLEIHCIWTGPHFYFTLPQHFSCIIHSSLLPSLPSSFLPSVPSLPSIHPPFFYQVLIKCLCVRHCAFLCYCFHDASSFHPFIFNLAVISYLTYVSHNWHIDESFKNSIILIVIMTLTGF